MLQAFRLTHRWTFLFGLMLAGGLLAGVLAGCGLRADTPAAIPVLARSTDHPTLPPPTRTPRPVTPTPYPLPAGLFQSGRWTWTRFTTDADTYPPVQLWLDINADGTVSGVLSVYPNPEDIPASALTLIQQNGCNVAFSSLKHNAFNGRFNLDGYTSGRVSIEVSACTVKFYGDVVLSEPVRGEFLIAYDEALTQALLNPVDVPLTPLERGRKVFSQYCSACHGTYGEGAPGIPSLHTDQVRNYTDEQILTIMQNGVINTVMPAWGAVLSEEEIMGTLELIRNIDILD